MPERPSASRGGSDSRCACVFFVFVGHAGELNSQDYGALAVAEIATVVHVRNAALLLTIIKRVLPHFSLLSVSFLLHNL